MKRETVDGSRELAYGRGSLPLEGGFEGAEVLVPAGVESVPDGEATLRVAVEAAARRALEATYCPSTRGSVLIAVPDVTRYAATERILPWILDTFDRMGGVPPAHPVKVLFALGIHRPLTREEQIGILGPAVASRVEFADHDAEGPCVSRGTTSRGTPIEFHPEVDRAGAVLLLGAASFHYFAGFGGGRKLLIPGLSSAAACRRNHLLVLRTDGPGRHPGVGPGRLAGNPVHEDMMEALASFQRTRHVSAITALLNTRKEILGGTAGDPTHAFEEACELYRQRFRCPIRGRRPVVLVSSGGHPKDINFIQAHKTLEYAMEALEPGGTLVVLAECPQGFGHPGFLPWFDHDGLAAMERALRERYEIYGQTAWATACKAARADILLLSALPPADVARMGLRPIRSLSEAAVFVRKKHGTCPPTYVIPFGAGMLPVVEPDLRMEN